LEWFKDYLVVISQT